MNPHPEITIQPFQPEYQSQARDLILAGLVEHWGWLDPGKNPDLEDIARSYAKAHFLVALQDGKVVGTGALVPQSAETAQIVRMSVAAGMRRKGVGSRILQSLCACAKAIGCKRLVLETTAAWGEVIQFYERFGFHRTHDQDGDAYFALELSNLEGEA